MIVGYVIYEVIYVVVDDGYIIASFDFFVWEVCSWTVAKTILFGLALTSYIFTLVLFPLITFESFSRGKSWHEKVVCASEFGRFITMEAVWRLQIRIRCGLRQFVFILLLKLSLFDFWIFCLSLSVIFTQDISLCFEAGLNSVLSA